MISRKIAQYTVFADRKTGQWIGEPQYIRKVHLEDWYKKTDTTDAHFDTYQVWDEDDVRSTTRAIEVVWQD
jgi:hypothetical protein